MGLDLPTNSVQVAIPHLHGAVLRPAIVTIGAYDPGGTFTAGEVVDIVVENYVNTIGAYIDASVAIGPGIGTVQLSEGNYATVAGTFTGAGARSADDSLTPAVAAIIRKTTPRPGRAGRGRMFLPWALEGSDVTEAGFIINPTTENLQQAADDFLADTATADIVLMLFHTEGIPGGSTPSPIIAFTPDEFVGTQRRRQRG